MNGDDGQPARSPFVCVPEWVLLAGLTPQAVALYAVLRAHVNGRTGTAWPSLDRLAELMRFNRRHSVLPYLRELTDLGIVEMRTVTCPTGRRNEYAVRDQPPPGWVRPQSMAEHYAALRAEPITEPFAKPFAKPFPGGFREDSVKGSAQGGPDATASYGSDGQASDGSDAPAAKNQTDRTRPIDRDRTTSSDAASGAPRASSRGGIKILVPADFHRTTDGQVHQHLVKASVGVLRHAGYPLMPDAGDHIGRWLKKRDTLDRDQLLRELEDALRQEVEKAQP